MGDRVSGNKPEGAIIQLLCKHGVALMSMAGNVSQPG